MVKAPFAAQAARRFAHPPGRCRDRQKLPVGSVQVICVGKPSQPHTRQQCAKREDDSAQKRPFSQPEEVGAGKHHSLTVAASAYFAANSISRSDSVYGARSTPRSVKIAVTYFAGVTSNAGLQIPTPCGVSCFPP